MFDHYPFYLIILLSSQALISQDAHTMRDTVVTENGKVIPEPTGSIDSDSVSQFYPLPRDFFVDIKQNRPLRLKRKLYEFYTAPITKFYAHSVSLLGGFLLKFGSTEGLPKAVVISS